MESNTYDFYIVGKNRVLKGIRVKNKNCKAKILSKKTTEQVTKGEITALAWKVEDPDQKFFAAFESGSSNIVRTFDCELGRFGRSYFDCKLGEGKVVGITNRNDNVITAVRSGNIQLSAPDGSNLPLFEAGADLSKMRATGDRIATGGLENHLKVFDLEKREKLFTAKNMPNNKLQLRVPVDVSDLRFLTNPEQLVTVNKFGNIYLYDTRAQRRPVEKMTIQDEALSALAVMPNDKQVVFGTGKGKLKMVDMRSTTKVLSTFKGATGAVTGLEICERESLLVSIGLDRHLNIHHLESKKLVKRLYLTSKLLSLLVNSNFTMSEEEEMDDETFFTKDVEEECE